MEYENIKHERNIPVLYRRLSIDKNHLLRDLHFHDEIEIIRANNGQVECNIEEKTITLSCGESVVINRRVRHRIIPNCPMDFSYLQINVKDFLLFLHPDGQNKLLAFLSDQTLSFVKCDSGNEINIIFDNIVNLLTDKTEYYDIEIKGEVLKLIASLYKNGFLPSPAKLLKDKQLTRIRPAILFAENNFSEDISADSVAEVLQTDRFYLCKLFKRATGRTFFEYVNFLRLTYAEELLLNTDQTVSEIAYRSGFSSIQYFNRIFKKKNNHSPKEWRKMKTSKYLF